MKMWMKIALCISLSFMCIFVCVGYASLNSELTINGMAESSPPDALFITNVSGGNYIDPNTLYYSGTIVSSTITLRENTSGEYEAFFDVTVFNNTPESYYYVAKVRGTYTMPDGTIVSYSNENIELTVDENDLPFATEIKPGQTKTFTVRAHFAQNATDTSDKTLFSIIEYQFQTTKPESKDEAAVAGVLDKFPEVLNSPSEHEKLTNAMSNSSWGRLSTSYIGNVVNATDQDSTALQEIFGESMLLNIDGEDKPVTIMIKRENIDGNRNTGEDYKSALGITQRGAEMTLYITADPLTSAGASVPVYAIVYTKNVGSDTWTQLGTTFKGTATVVSYIGGSGTGSFNTDSWRSTDGKTIEDLI